MAELETASLRRAQSEDAVALFCLAKEFATSFAVEREAFQHSLSQLLVAPDAYLVVAELDDSTVGYLLGFDHYTLFANGRVACVEEIMVSKNHRRKGIGESLINSFESWSSKRGSKLVGLATRRAEAFYKALDYEQSAAHFRKVF